MNQWIRLGIVLAMALGAGNAMAQEKAVDKTAKEVQEQFDQLKKWVTDKVDNLSAPRETEPKPLGKTVALEFSIQGFSQPVTVSTSTSKYELDAKQSGTSSENGVNVFSKYAIAASGTIEPNEPRVAFSVEGSATPDATFLVTCKGEFTVEHQDKAPQDITAANSSSTTISSSSVRFDSSVSVRLGEKAVLIQQGQYALVMRVIYPDSGAANAEATEAK